MQKTTKIARGLFYNTAPLGLGHLVRSIYLCRGLIKAFHIDFIY